MDIHSDIVQRNSRQLVWQSMEKMVRLQQIFPQLARHLNCFDNIDDFRLYQQHFSHIINIY